MDGASSGDDAGDAVGRQGDVPQQHASMDCEVVHALQPRSLITFSATPCRALHGHHSPGWTAALSDTDSEASCGLTRPEIAGGGHERR